MPQALAARLAVLVVTTVATTVVPVLVQDRPILKWTWNRFGPVIETRVKDRVQDRLDPQVETVPVNHRQPQLDPQPYNDGVQLTVPACVDPHHHYVHRPVVNPNGYCRRHWWTAGPVRWIVSLPFRLFR